MSPNATAWLFFWLTTTLLSHSETPRPDYLMFFDLTMPLSAETPVYPGDPAVEIGVSAQFATAGCLDHVLRIGTHAGTHIDAPAHMIEGAPGLDAYGLERFLGRGRLIDITNGSADLSTVQADDIVLLKTGFSDSCWRADYYDLVPDIGSDTAQRLVELGVKAVGIDAGSVDSEPFPIHKTLLAGDVLIIENLIGLERLVGVESFQVIALPLRLALEASPARVIATY